MDQKPITLIEGVAQTRGELPVLRNFIEEALIKIKSGEEDVTKYPTATPSLKDVFNIAIRIESESATKN